MSPRPHRLGSMAVDSDTTASDAEALMLDNLNYSAGGGNLTMAETFVEAARAWILLNPSRAIHGGRGGEEIHLNIEQVMEMLSRALEWIEAYRASGGTKFYDFSDYKS